MQINNGRTHLATFWDYFIFYSWKIATSVIQTLTNMHAVSAPNNFNCETSVCKEPLICLDDYDCGCPDNLEYDYSLEICINEEGLYW